MDLPRQTNYDTALALALDALRQTDLSRRCAHGGATWDPERGTVRVGYLGGVCVIEMPGGRFQWEGDPGEVALADRILVLHYLNRAGGTPLAGKLISFGEVPGGRQYLPAFRKRSVDILLSTFGHRPQELLVAASGLGGTQAVWGDASATVHALPRVPITFVLWGGDDEVRGSANILFDVTVSEYLPTEDIAVLAQTACVRLSRALASRAGQR